MRKIVGPVRHQIGRRGAFLGFLAFLDYVYAFAFWQIPGMPVMGPPIVWAIAWFGAAVACTVGTFLRKDRVPYTIASTVKTAFAAQFCYLWVVRHMPYGWIDATFWFVFSLVVLMISSWPDPIFINAAAKRR